MKAASKISSLLLLLIALITAGCAEASSVSGLDTITSTTKPVMSFIGVLEARLSYATGEKPFTADNIVLSDFNGTITITCRQGFDGDVTPQYMQGKQNMVWCVEDALKHQTRFSFISRNVFKRTDVVYGHNLPSRGFPVLREDGTKIIAGIAGKEGRGGCYIALLSLKPEKVYRVTPDGFSKDELETGEVFPVGWVGITGVSVMRLQDGRSILLATDEKGNIVSNIELPASTGYGDAPFNAWVAPSGQSSRVIIAIPDGYIDADIVQKTAVQYKLNGPSPRILGPDWEMKRLIWVSTEPGGYPMVNIESLSEHKTTSSEIYGQFTKPMSIGNVLYSYREECIYFEAENDIWRMNLKSGIQGPFTVTPDIHETLLWTL